MRSLLMGTIFLFSGAHAFAQNYVPGEVIVKLKNQVGTNESYAFLGKAHSQKEMTLKESFGKMGVYHFALKKGQTVEAAVQELKADPEVLYAEPNYYLSKTQEVGMHEVFSAAEVQAAANQSQSYQATSAPIGVQSVWSSSSSVPTVKPVVAVVDTGLDLNHYVFNNTQAIWRNTAEANGQAGVDDDGNGYVDDVNGWNYVSNSPSPMDDDGHGTHVSGIILSVDQNIFATPLRESKIKIMPLKFLNNNGVGTTSNAIRAIYYAVNNGASVINNSWGGTSYSAALHEAVAYSYSNGVAFIAAAGNSAMNNDSTPMYPASYDVPNVISIAATTDYDYLATFSNFGAGSVHLGSPGVSILSTVRNNAFGTSSGTSMATPFVAGTVAQMLVEKPSMLGYQLKTIVLGQYDTVPYLNGKVTTSGRLDSEAAVNYAKAASVDASQPSYSVSYGADRELASELAGGGCGTVRAMTDKQPPYGNAVVVVVLLLAPILLLLAMRLLSPQNRRKHERFSIDSDVRIKVGGRELYGSVSSISLGGVCVNTDALLQDGGLVTMVISSPNGGERVEVAGRIVWSEANKAYGVAFDQAPQGVLARIADWTRNLQKI